MGLMRRRKSPLFLEKLASDYQTFRSRIDIPSMEDTARRYLALFDGQGMRDPSSEA